MVRLRTFSEPLNRDLALYSVVADNWRAGRTLYKDLWDLKPPAIYWTYAFFQWATRSHDYLLIYAMSVCAASVTLLGIWRAALATRLVSRWTAASAATLYAVVWTDIRLQGNEPNTELFINACVVWSVCLLLELPRARRAWLWAAAAGVLLGVASLYKTVVVVYAGAFALVVLTSGVRRWHAVANAAWFLGAAGGVWVATVVGFALNGTLSDMWYAVFTFNRYYAELGGNGGVVGNILQGLRPNVMLNTAIMLNMLPLLALNLLVPWGMVYRRAYPQMLFLAWLLATPVVVAMPGQYAPHYYMYWIPVLCFGCAMAVRSWSTLFARWPALLSRRAGFWPIVLAVSMCLQLPYARLTPREHALWNYGQEVDEEMEAAVEIAKLLKADETFFHWGTCSTLYTLAHRRAPVGISAMSVAVNGPFAPEATWRVLADLERAKPPLLVMDDRNFFTRSAHPAIQWMLERYRIVLKVPDITERFSFWVLRGSELERRVEALNLPPVEPKPRP